MWLWKILRLKLLPVAWVGIPTAPEWPPTCILIKVLLVLTVCLIESKFCVGLWLTPIRLSSTLFLLLNYLGKKKKKKKPSPASLIRPWIMKKSMFVEAYPGLSFALNWFHLKIQPFLFNNCKSVIQSQSISSLTSMGSIITMPNLIKLSLLLPHNKLI